MIPKLIIRVDHLIMSNEELMIILKLSNKNLCIKSIKEIESKGL